MTQSSFFPSAVTRLEAALFSIDRLAVRRVFEEALAAAPPGDVVDKLVCPALEHIGNGWANGDMALSQVYMSARLCEEVVELVLPAPRAADHAPRLAILVLEDCHALGTRIVHAMLRAAGYVTLDYGINVSVDEAARRANEDRIDGLLVSTLMLRSALQVSQLTDRFRQAGRGTKVFVGGAPFNFDQELWREVGADGVGKTASDAIRLVATLGGES